jgi:long-chain fatty acid transport protein
VKVIKLGVSQVINDALTFRAGYSHNTQPIPTSQTMFNILAPGVVQDHVTLGATWNVSKTNELTLAYMHAFQANVNGVGAIPAGFGGGNANIKMYQDSLGIAYSWKL